MRLRVLVVLVVATFVASCNTFVNAQTNSLDDSTYDSNKEVHRLRGDSDGQAERRLTPVEPSTISAVVEGGGQTGVVAKVKTWFGSWFSKSTPETKPLNTKGSVSSNSEGPHGNSVKQDNSPPPPPPPHQPESQTTPEQPPRKSTPPTNSEEKAHVNTEGPESPKNKEETVHPDTPHTRSNKLDTFINSFTDKERELLKKRNIDVEELKKGNEKQIFKIMGLAVKGAKPERGFWTEMFIWQLYALGFVSFIMMAYLLMSGGPIPHLSHDHPAAAPAGA